MLLRPKGVLSLREQAQQRPDVQCSSEIGILTHPRRPRSQRQRPVQCGAGGSRGTLALLGAPSIEILRDGSILFRFTDADAVAALEDSMNPSGSAAASAAADMAAEGAAEVAVRVDSRLAGAIVAEVQSHVAAADSRQPDNAAQQIVALQDLQRRNSHARASSSNGVGALDGARVAAAAMVAQTAPPDLLARHGLDAADSDCMSLLGLFSDLANHGQLVEALAIVEAAAAANRRDVLGRLRQKHFLRMAKKHKAVDAALRFVELLPSSIADHRTYTMLVSVCAAAADSSAALRAADMWRATGRKLDTFLYTNVISACARGGDADAADALYQQMRDDGCQLDSHVFSTLISAYAGSVAAAEGGSLQHTARRAHLKLLEQAFHLLEDMRELKLQPDVVVFNALITLAGRVGQLKRAQDVVSDMEAAHCRPDAHTYAALIDACCRAGKPDIALKFYGRALTRQVTQSCVVYTAAIGACKVDDKPDLQEAMHIYRDMQRHGVQPDAQLFGGLMSVAGAAGDVDLAFSLLDDMTAQDVRPCQGTLSALLIVCVTNGQMQRALEVLQSMRARQVTPTLRAFNALVFAQGRAFRLGDAADLVEDLLAAGHQPDVFTFAALLMACQRAEEAELAFDTLRLMSMRGIKMGEVHAFSLLRLCFNNIRAMWRPGGYPPTADAHALPSGARRGAEGAVLLRALGGTSRPLSEAAASADDWRNRALQVYRELLAHEKPRLHVLDRLLSCLRAPLPADANKRKASISDLEAHGMIMGGSGGGRTSMPAEAPGVWGGYTEQAVRLVEEAISMTVLPGFKLGEGCCVDLQRMPPSVAEVYTLAVLQRLRIRPNHRTKVEHSITFKVPAFDAANIFSPSYIAAEDSPDAAASQPVMEVDLPQQHSGDFENYVAGSATGLGVAATLRRLKLFPNVADANGEMFLSPNELTRWSRATARAENNLRSSSRQAGIWEPGRLLNTPVAMQARDIRMRDGVTAGRGAAGRGRSGRGRGRGIPGPGHSIPDDSPSWQLVLQAGSGAGAQRRWQERRSQQPQEEAVYRGDGGRGDDEGHYDSRQDGDPWPSPVSA